MKRMESKKSVFYWIFFLIVTVISGCSGPQSTKQADVAKVKRPDRSIVSSVPGEDQKKTDIVKQEQEEPADKERLSVAGPTPPAPSVPEARADTPRVFTPEPPRLNPKPAPGPAKAPEAAASPEKTGPKMVLNFDNADLYAVIGTIGELLGINYIVDPNVAGKVTINTAGGLYKKDLFPIFLQILEVNGLTAIKEGSVYRVVQLKDSARMPIVTRLLKEGEDLPPMDKIVIQIIPLQFIATQEMVKLLTPFVSAGGTIVADAGSNTLLVVDKGINILKILKLVQTFDVNMLERVSYRFYPVKYLDVEDVSKTLGDFTSSYEKVGSVVVKFIPITKLNTLFVVSTSPLVFEKVEEILRQIDIIDREAAPKIYVYFVKNGMAEELAGLLDKVFGKKTSSKDKTTSSKKKAGGSATLKGNPLSEARIAQKEAAEKAAAKSKAEAPAQKTPAAAKGEDGAGAGTLLGAVNITADEIRNALIIEAIPSDHRIVEDILRQIDVLPRQVLIEATIAEISVNTNTEFGMEWAFGQGAAQGKASFAATINKVVGTGTDAAASGLKYSIGVTDKWYAALHALASEGKVNVLSSPHVLASDNKEAKIDVSREIPVASGTTTIASSTVIGQTTIQYRDTGVILSVTPHINDRGLVTMDISEEVSDLEKQTQEVAGEQYPAFFKRTVSTTLTVRHGQTIAIGGLIKDKEDESITGVPCLIKIPVVRYLFGEWGKSVEKIELIVLITPRVVANLDDVDAVTDEFKQKVKNVMRRFYPQS